MGDGALDLPCTRVTHGTQRARPDRSPRLRPPPQHRVPGDDASIGGGGSSQGSGASMGLTTSGTESVSGGEVSGGSGTGTGSSGDPSSGQSSGSTGSGEAGGYVVRNCASTPCDLRSKTCCLPADGGYDASYCVEGNTLNCGADIITYHCLGAIDCPKSGDLCCGIYDLTAMTASTACQTSCGSNPQFCIGRRGVRQGREMRFSILPGRFSFAFLRTPDPIAV